MNANVTPPVTPEPLNIRLIDFEDADLSRQLDLEDLMREEGKETYIRQAERERARGNASAAKGARAVITAMSTVVAEKIAEELERLESGKVRKKPPMLATLRLVPPADLSILLLRTLVDVLSVSRHEGNTTGRLASKIGTAVETEVAARQFRKHHRVPFETLMRRLNSRGASPEQRGRAILDVVSKLDVGERDWILDSQERTRLGALLLYLAEEAGIVRSANTLCRRRASKVFEFTEEFELALLRSDALASELRPALMPTIIPPRPWVGASEGGYWTPMKGVRLVSTRHASNGVKQVEDTEVPQVFNAVNYLQQVPFRVNRRVLDVLSQAQDHGIAFEALPSFTPEELPPKPDIADDDKEGWRAWRTAAREVHNRNNGARGRILAAQRTLATADLLKDEARIWFPKFLDFRGRVYDTPNTLKPQGNDLCKGLLEFGTGKPLGEGDGAWWLAIHGSNVFGNDKVSLSDRADWTMDNSKAILEVAQDPLANRWWLDADKPAQFLAFCFEWGGYLTHGKRWLSRLPVAMDGSCNGLQHLSASLRDTIGGSSVNLIPSALPNDIYTRVMDVVVERLKNRAAMGEPTAQAWLPLMKRSVVKRPVMTLPYGATRQGFTDQIIEDTLIPLEREGRSPFTERQHAASYLSGLVWEATGEVVVAARQAMDWLQQVARVASRAGVPLEWATPSGWVVRQNYVHQKDRQVKLYVSGQQYVMRLRDADETSKIDTRKMAMGVAPNWVHSMDASHMIRTVEAVTATAGYSVHLAMVHDSFSTHAADAHALSRAIRSSFVEIYEEEHWLERFREEIASQLSEKDREQLPEVPEMGDLDIEEVLQSSYFFA